MKYAKRAFPPERFSGMYADIWYAKPASRSYGFYVEAAKPARPRWEPVCDAVRLRRDGRLHRAGERVTQDLRGFQFLADAEAFAGARSDGNHSFRYRVVCGDPDPQLISCWHQGRRVSVPGIVSGIVPTISAVSFEKLTEQFDEKLKTYYNPDQTTEEIDMETEPLRIPRETLIEKIDEQLARDKKAWDDERAEQQKAEQEQIAKIEKALKENPVALLRALSQLHPPADYATPESYVERLNNVYPETKAQFVPDATAEKLKRVLQAASNEEIEVRPTDNVYRYL